MAFGKKTLFSLLLGFDFLANILELTHFNFLFMSTLISFCTYILLPGFLISLILRIKKISFWENLLFIVGLSITFLEFGGLLLNILLPLIGMKNPLAFQNLVVGFNIYVLLLFIVAWRRTKPFVLQFPEQPVLIARADSKKHAKSDQFTTPGIDATSGMLTNVDAITPIRVLLPRHSRSEKILYTIPVFFPVLATLGAIVLNNGGSNILTLILLGAIAFYTLLLVIFRDKISISLYAHALFFIGMACLFTTSLRSWYIAGADIEAEFYVFRLTNAHHLWNMAFYHDAYNACLSITILPTILTNFLSIQDMYIYKLFFQILFAITPVIVFFLMRKYTSSVFAFLSAFFFISFPTFLNDMPMANRQEIGFIFFGLILYVMLQGNQPQQYYAKEGTHPSSTVSLDAEKEEALLSLAVSLDVAKEETHPSSEASLDLAKEQALLSSSVSLISLDLTKEATLISLAVSLDVANEEILISSAASPNAAKEEAKEFPAPSPELSLTMRRMLFIIFALSVIVSHYSTNFVLLVLVTFVYVAASIISRSFVKNIFGWLLVKSHVKVKNTFPNNIFLSLPLIVLLFLLTYAWNNLYTNSSNHVASILVEVVSSIFVTSGVDTRSGDLSYSIFFSPPKQSPEQVLQEYIDSARQPENSKTDKPYSRSITSKYPIYPVPQEQLAPTPLGNLLSSYDIPVFDMQAELRSLSADFMQIFVFIGLLAIFFLKNKNPIHLQYLLLCCGALFLLALIILLPDLSIEYGVLRIFQQLLFVFALPIVIGLSSVLFFVKERERIVIIGVITIIFFLTLTGFVSHLTGDYYPQMTLDNSGLYYDAYYVDKSDVFAIVWLSENDVNNEHVDANLASGQQLLPYGGIIPTTEIFPGVIQRNDYVFLKISTNKMVSFYKDTLFYNSPKSFMDDNKNLIYSNGEYNIYK